MYLERAVGRQPRPVIRIDGREFDVDYFGMDDGAEADPDHARRFLFQLGYGYMIHLYVIQAGSTASPGLFHHTFWTKDCAVAEVEQEDHGPPSRVEAAPIELPLLFGSVEVAPKGGRVRRLRIVSARFAAASAAELGVTFELDEEGAASTLRWSRAGGWAIEGAGTAAALGDGATLRFVEPMA